MEKLLTELKEFLEEKFDAIEDRLKGVETVVGDLQARIIWLIIWYRYTKLEFL
jgi:hypothetical protein